MHELWVVRRHSPRCLLGDTMRINKTVFAVSILTLGLAANAFALGSGPANKRAPASVRHHKPSLFSISSIKEMCRYRRLPKHNWLDGSEVPTAVPSNSAPQDLNELHERAGDAIVYALGRDKNLPTFTFTASNVGAGSNIQTFSAQQIFGLPAAMPVTSGKPQDPFVMFRLNTMSGKDATCFYKANKSSYDFDYCTSSISEAVCSAGKASWCKGTALDLGLKATDTVIAKSISVRMNSCGSKCNGNNSMQATVRLENANSACGGLALSSVHLLDNVNCTAPGNVGFEMAGKNLTLNGYGNSIAAPNSLIGLFVTGDNNTVKNLDVSEVGGGFGLYGYNTNGINLSRNRFRANLVGVNLYNDSVDPKNVRIEENDISSNAFSGLIMAGDEKYVDQPQILGNNFMHTGGYAVSLAAKSAYFVGTQKNLFTGSKSVLYLSHGDFTVEEMNLGGTGATGPQIFVEQANSFTLSHVNLSYITGATANQERTALHLYRVGNAKLSQLIVNGADVGLKATTEQDTNTAITMSNSKITNSQVAGVMLQSFDATRFGLVKIKGNDLTKNPQNYSVWLVGESALGTGSDITGNTQ